MLIGGIKSLGSRYDHIGKEYREEGPPLNPRAPQYLQITQKKKASKGS